MLINFYTFKEKYFLLYQPNFLLNDFETSRIFSIFFIFQQKHMVCVLQKSLNETVLLSTQNTGLN